MNTWRVAILLNESNFNLQNNAGQKQQGEVPMKPLQADLRFSEIRSGAKT